jgi:hypothetical protein
MAKPKTAWPESEGLHPVRDTLLPTWSSRRINYLASKLTPKNYLEIGVAKGRTFFHVDIQRKVAVDPKFRFRYSPLQSDSVRFFEIPSDRFFAQHAGNEKFDFIFLDGMHTFEQTFRDLCNSFFHCHDRTLWMIDDTYPCDIYSAMTNQKEALQARKRAGGQRLDWHGDVFKIVFAIHDFFPSLNYCTLGSNGNPQTLIWNEPRVEVRPLLNSLDSISKMTYHDFQKHLSLLQVVPEEQGLELAISALSK